MKYWDIFESELGPIRILCDEDAVLVVDFNREGLEGARQQTTELIKKTALQLNEYLSGKRNEFQLPLRPKGTEFQKKVWEALQTIPYGQTKSYKEIAVQIGKTKGMPCSGNGQ